MKPIMIVLDDWEGRIAASGIWKKIHAFVDIHFVNGNAPMDAGISENASIIMALRERTRIDEKLLARFPRLQLILQTGGHAYHIDLEAAKRRNVAVVLGRAVKAPLASVPELTIAMMLNLSHKIIEADRAMRQGKWPLLMGRTLQAKRLGILGMGRHGTRVAQIAEKAFGMDVVAWERRGLPAEKISGIPRLPLEDLLRSSDVVSIHLKLSDESMGLINAENISWMKSSAFLINTSRGAIVDERALIAALQKKQLAGAGLDVFELEPLPVDSPLRTLDNVVLTSHIGWTVEEVFEEFAEIAWDQLQDWLKGEGLVAEIK